MSENDPPKRNRRPRPLPAERLPMGSRPTDLYDEAQMLGILETYDGPATIRDLARVTGVSATTVSGWLNKHPAFFRRVMELRELANDRAEASLYQRAVGYEAPLDEDVVEEKKLDPDTGEMIVVKTRTTARKTYLAPDVGALKFWLTNRRRDDWSERKVIEDHRSYHELLTEAARQHLDLPPDAYEEIVDADEAEE